MPVLIPVIAGAAAQSIIAGALAASLGTIAAGAIGAIAGGILAAGVGRLTGLYDKPDNLTSRAQAGRLQNFAGSVEPVPVIYGRRRVGGPFILRESTGDRNQFIYLVMPISEGPIDAVETIHLGERVSTDPRIIPYFLSEVRLGTDGQVAIPWLVNEVEGWTDSAVGNKLAYIGMRFKWEDDTDNRPVWPVGIPTTTLTVRGKRVYDPRNNSVAWSQNPSLCILDYLMNPIYGRGAAEAGVDMPSFVDSAWYCDQMVDTPGGRQKRYTLDGIIDTSRSIRENMIDMLATCRGLLIYSGGKWQLRIDRPETGLGWGFTERNIVGRWSFSTGAAADRPNRVKVTWTDPENDFQPKVSLVGSPAMLESDRGVVLESNLDLGMVTNRYRAEQLAGLELKQARQSIAAEFVASLEGIRAGIGDVVPITHTTPGWAAKPFRVWRMALTEDDHVRVSVREYDESVYVLDDLDAAPVRPDTNLPDPWLIGVPENVQLQAGTDDLLIGSDGTVITRLLVTWEPPRAARAARYEIEFKPSVQPLGWVRMETTALDIYIQPVVDRRQYDVRIRSVNLFGRKSEWVTETGFTIIGKTQPPPRVLGFHVSTDANRTRIFRWDEISQNEVPDLAGYLIRYAAGTSIPVGGFNAMSPLHTGILTHSPHETNQPPSGPFAFGIKARDTSGNVSAFASFYILNLGQPPGNSIFEQYARFAGWPGTKIGCIVEGPILRAVNDGTWDELTSWTTWTEWANHPRSPITYEHSELNFGPAVNGTVDVRAVTSGGTQTLQMRFHDGSAWGAWATPPSSFTSKTRCQMRVTVTGSNPVISDMILLIYP